MNKDQNATPVLPELKTREDEKNFLQDLKDLAKSQEKKLIEMKDKIRKSQPQKNNPNDFLRKQILGR